MEFLNGHHGEFLVTGGAGFIGSNIASSLLARGHTVRVLDNFLTAKKENLAALKGKAEFVQGDLRDADATRRACDGARFENFLGVNSER